MLSCVLLHVVPSPLPVNLLADLVADCERLRRVKNAAQTVSLCVLYWDGFFLGAAQCRQSSMIAWLSTTWNVQSLFI